MPSISKESQLTEECRPPFPDPDAANSDDLTPNRRELLLLGALGGTVALAGSACSRAPEPSSPPASAPADPTDFELNEQSIRDLQAAMDRGALTARRITELYLGRIEQIDRQGPTLGSVIETNPDALAIAQALDEERAQSGPRGPLHGIPILLKDNIATHDRTTTTAGAHALEGSIPSADSFVAKRLREAGAVLLGKANLSEWANFRSTNSSSGWSGRGGQCRNPYVLDRSPCGSSSGSGAATSANLCAAAIGTETNGSILCPSSINGLVGIKPTVGLVSRSRIIPIAHSQDTAGPMARSVRDAALVLGALTGVDPDDPATAASEGKAHSDYTPFLTEDGLSGKRLGLVREYMGKDPRVDALVDAAVQVMQEHGAEVVDPVEVPTYQELGEHSFQVLLYEFKADLNAYLAALGPDAPVRSLADIIAFNKANAERTMPHFGQELLIMAEEKGPLTSTEYLEALATGQRLAREGLDRTLDEHRLDALIAPSNLPAWKVDYVRGDGMSGGSSTPAAVSGYPNITVPAGFVGGLPIGLSFFGRAWSEGPLLRLAYSFEQATRHRRAPTFIRSLEFA